MELIKFIVREISIISACAIGAFIVICIFSYAGMYVRNWLNGYEEYAVSRWVGRICVGVIVIAILLVIVWAWI